MPYVERVEGTIRGLYAALQEGYAEEFLPDDDAEVVAFLTPPELGPVESEPVRVACALRVPVLDGEVQQIGGPYRIMAMILMDTGTFLTIFSEHLGDEQPFVIPNNGVSVDIAEWGGDYAMIEVRDHAGGALITPSSFGFSLYHL